MPERTIFQRLMAKELPAFVVYEDEHVFAFLDIEPLSPGHTLLVPRRAVARLADLTEQEGSHIGRALPRLCRAVSRATGVSDYNVLQNNGSLAHQAVPHVHFHIIPRPNAERGLQLQWHTHPLEKTEGENLRQSIVRELS